MDDSVSFGYWVRRRRKSLDLTQAELAQRVGCAAKTIQKFEADVRRPSKVMGERLADALELAPDTRFAFLTGARTGAWGGAESMPSRPADAPVLERPRDTGALPVPMTPLIGRAREAAAVCDLLDGTPVRLVTLSGPGGVGKTRLALQAAADLQPAFDDGVVFVNLAPIRTADLVPTAIAVALGLRERDGPALVTRLQVALREQHLLLVLDNFEHVVAAAQVVADLLAAAPRLKVLITSRSVVGVYGEHDFPVLPLPLPDLSDLSDPDRLFQVETVRLFVERARAATPNFSLTTANAGVVSEICHYLDGLPLAIELAAARVRLLPPAALLQRLTGSAPGGASGRLDVLTGGPRTLPARQQTLRNTLAWSYNLLEPDMQRLFRRLGVFVGGGTLQAVETVCGGEGEAALDTLAGLQALLDANLVEQREGADGEPRFSMLETIREYAWESLVASGELERLQRQHAGYFVVFVETSEAIQSGSGLGSWWDHLESDHANIRAALTWSRTEAGGATGLRLADAVSTFWRTRGYLSEGRGWLEDVVRQREMGGFAAPQTDADRRLLARAAGSLGIVAMFAGDLDAALAWGERSIALFRELGDREGIALGTRTHGHLFSLLGDQEQARALLEESLSVSRDLGNEEFIVSVLAFLGTVAYARGDGREATEHWEEGLRRAHAAGNIEYWKANVELHLAIVVLEQGDDERARALVAKGLTYYRDVDDRPATAFALDVSARLVAEQGQRSAEGQEHLRRAARLFGAAEALREVLDVPDPLYGRQFRERGVTIVRGGLDATICGQAWAEGRAMTLEQAIGYALEEVRT